MLEIRRLTAEEGWNHLAEVLVDCVEGGASVSFMLPIPKSSAEAFFKGCIESLEPDERILIAAFLDSKRVGTVQLVTARRRQTARLNLRR